MKVLFLCAENACRSQIAEAIFRHLAGSGHSAFSAGTRLAKDIDPLAVEVLKEIGIDVAGQRPKLLTQEMAEQVDKVISMGCIEGCPLVKIDEDWAIEDPKGKGIEKFRQIRDEISEKVKSLLNNIESG